MPRWMCVRALTGCLSSPFCGAEVEGLLEDLPRLLEVEVLVLLDGLLVHLRDLVDGLVALGLGRERGREQRGAEKKTPENTHSAVGVLAFGIVGGSPRNSGRLFAKPSATVCDPPREIKRSVEARRACRAPRRCRRSVVLRDSWGSACALAIIVQMAMPRWIGWAVFAAAAVGTGALWHGSACARAREQTGRRRRRASGGDARHAARRRLPRRHLDAARSRRPASSRRP